MKFQSHIRIFLSLLLGLTATPVFARGGGGFHGGGGGFHGGGGGGGFHGGGGGHFNGGGARFGGAPHMAAPHYSTAPHVSAAPHFNAAPRMGAGGAHYYGHLGGNRLNASHFAGNPAYRRGNPGFNSVNTFHHGNFANNGIANRNYGGNMRSFGNRNLAFANTAYRPSYYNHSLYHGYWNGNRFGGYGNGRYGLGGLGYGLGYGGLGYGGLGYGSGLGYGGLGYGGFGYPGYGYGYSPLGWGLAGWGLGSLLYGSGYLGYNNPYYGGYGGGGGTAVYNYSQPIPVAYDTGTAGTTSTPTSQSADSILDAAVGAFKQNDYDTALSLVNDGIKQYPSDAVMHEFRALVLFAKGDYQQAAATLHSVLAVGPGWDWTTLSGLYSDVSVYTSQLRSLEATVRQRPDDGAARFLLAYHYMSDGYPDAAAKQLREVIRIVPNDQVAASLLRMVTAQTASTPPVTPDGTSPSHATDGAAVPSPQAAPSSKPIDAAAVIGDWKAARPDGSSFELTLSGDHAFKWTFTPKGGSAQSFDGTYTVEGSVLALERKGGGAILATVDQTDPQHFVFKPVGAPPEDPGLSFNK